MRTKPSWSDCFPLEIFWTWLVAGLVLAGILLVSECAIQPAHAGLYLDAAGGVSHFLITANDGDYLQRGLPHTLDRNGLAYRVGIGWRFSDKWAAGFGAFNLGSLKQEARFVDDRDYSVQASQCVANCAAAVPNKITNSYRGLELTLSRTVTLNEDWALFLKAGGAWIHHKISVTRLDTAGFHQLTGEFPATVAGVGAAYQWVYAELNYYHGLGGSNGFIGQDQSWPLSKEMVVTWFGFKIPLS